MKEQSIGFREENSISAVGNKVLRRLSDGRVSFIQAKSKLKPSVQTQPAGRDLTACSCLTVTRAPSHRLYKYSLQRVVSDLLSLSNF